ncbi:DUF1992 domain-containing protein [Streptacidiphilus neutrinimicus]|uniref:DnaJ family domain-containing protein n=1 Tax=Streptacidiphilus neutrinimicus TaxID=105420 RepID=UPI0009FDECD9|nr:DUF1992 domain-containing protein [Streptacidiphilus neutrinimicus]
MTERKPAGVSFESWVDQQIREAQERGEFENLPGSGEPLPDLDEPYDELWWVRQKLAREGLSFLPPTLALRKEAEDELTAAATAPTEADVRRIVLDINEKIRRSLRGPTEGPPLNLVPYDVEDVVDDWRSRRPSPTEEPPAPPVAESARRRGLLRRLLRRRAA